MKVLNRVDYSGWRYKFVCSHCMSTLEAEPSDLRPQYHPAINDCRPGESSPAYHTYHVVCAVCQHERQVPTNEVPVALQHFLEEKVQDRR